MDIDELIPSPGGELTMRQVRLRINKVIVGRKADQEVVKELPTKDYVDNKTNDLDIADTTVFTHQSPSRRSVRVYVQSKISNDALTSADEEQGVAPSKKAVVDFVDSSNADAIKDMIADKTYQGNIPYASTSTDWPTSTQVSKLVRDRVKKAPNWTDDTATTSSKEILSKINGKADYKVHDHTLTSDTTTTDRAPSRKNVVDYVKTELADFTSEMTYPAADIILNSISDDWTTGTQVSRLLRTRIKEEPVWTNTVSTTSSSKILEKINERADLKVVDTELKDSSTSTTKAPSKRAVAEYVKTKIETLRVQKTVGALSFDPLYLGTITGIRFYIHKERDIVQGTTSLKLTWDKPIALEGSTGSTYRYRSLGASAKSHNIGQTIDVSNWEGYVSFRGHTRVDDIGDFKSITINITNSNDKKKFNFLAASL